MRAMRAGGFEGYGDLKLTDIPKPRVSEGRVLVRITAAGVTPLGPEDIHERKRLWSSGQKEPVWLKTRTARIFRSARA
jgi:NADPH:quinone reductase-like Zn-dependent oxidoreductase